MLYADDLNDENVEEFMRLLNEATNKTGITVVAEWGYCTELAKVQTPGHYDADTWHIIWREDNEQ